MFSIFFSLLLNVNFIAALLGNGWKWIVENWLPDMPSIIIMGFFYLLVHYLLIFGWKTAINNLKQ